MAGSSSSRNGPLRQVWAFSQTGTTCPWPSSSRIAGRWSGETTLPSSHPNRVSLLHGRTQANARLQFDRRSVHSVAVVAEVARQFRCRRAMPARTGPKSLSEGTDWRAGCMGRHLRGGHTMPDRSHTQPSRLAAPGSRTESRRQLNHSQWFLIEDLFPDSPRNPKPDHTSAARSRWRRSSRTPCTSTSVSTSMFAR